MHAPHMPTHMWSKGPVGGWISVPAVCVSVRKRPRNRPLKEQKRPIDIGVPQVAGSAAQAMLEASRVHAAEGRGEECRKRKCMALVRELSGQSLDEDVFWRENFQNRQRYIQMMKHLEKVRLCVWGVGGVRVMCVWGGKGKGQGFFEVMVWGSQRLHTHTHTHTHY